MDTEPPHLMNACFVPGTENIELNEILQVFCPSWQFQRWLGTEDGKGWGVQHILPAFKRSTNTQKEIVTTKVASTAYVLEWLKLFKMTIPIAGEELSFIAGRNAEGYRHTGQ